MAKTQIAGKQVLDGSIKLEDLDTELSNTITGLDSRVEAIEAGQVNVDLSGIEADISALQSADVALDDRLDSAEASLISLDERVDALEAGGVGGGGSGASGASYEIAEFSHSQQSGTSSSSYVITHNLNTLTPSVELQVLASAGDFGATTSGWMNIPDFHPSGNFAVYFGHNIEIIDANSIRVVLFNLGAGHKLVRGKVFSGVGASASSGSGAIEVFQDEEFNWTTSGTRTITHNKGRKPDLIKVFIQANNKWVEATDLYFHSLLANGDRGWVDSSQDVDTTTHVKISMFAALYGTTPKTRIRLYWFGSQDVGTASAGAFSVGGGSGAADSFTSEIINAPNNGASAVSVEQNVVHGLGRKPASIQVYFDLTDAEQPGRILPIATAFWGGPEVKHIDDDTIRVKVWATANDGTAKLRVACM